ncbi:MAG: hypothetical protein AB1391_04225 [Candidatus Micrarchaeota archaeon]
MNKIRGLQIMLMLCMLMSVMFAQSSSTPLEDMLKDLCLQIKAIVPIMAFLMIVAAGVVYAGGQLLGAETRARASVWATAMFMGAIIGIVIVAIVPGLLEILYPDGTFSC